MNFLRQRVAWVFLVLGLLASWVGLTTLVVKQTVVIPGQFTSYASKALENNTARSEISSVLAKSIRQTNPILQNIPTSQLDSAIDSALKNPAVISEFSNVAFEIQQHLLGLQNGPIVVGGSTLSSAVAHIIAGNNSTEEQIISKIPFSYTIASSTIPSFGKYYRLMNSTISLSFLAAGALLLSSLIISAKKRSTLRKIGIWFIGFSAFEVALIWALPRYITPLIHSGSLAIMTSIMRVSITSVEPIYVGAFAAGIVLTIISFLV